MINPAQTRFQVDIFKHKELEKYWNTIYKDKILEDETIRIVRQIKDPNGEYGKYGYITEKDPIRTLEELELYINDLQTKNPGYDVGVSISTAIFKYIPGERPSIKNFKRTRSIAIDIDTHIKNTKERFELGAFGIRPDQHQIALMSAWVAINKGFKKHGLTTVKPSYSMLTGGGLQIVLDFERELDKNEAEKLFQLMKSAIGNLKWKTVLLTTSDYSAIDFDIDPTFSDIAHVQRVGGVINQKYGTYAKYIPLFELSDTDIISLVQNNINEMNLSGFTDEQKKAYIDDIRTIQDTFLSDRLQASETFEVQNNLMTAKMQTSRVNIRPSELQSIEYELLIKIKEAGIKVLDLLAGELKFGATTGNLTKIYCPFHEESNPSMAFYENDMIDVFRDFHDDKTYNFISFWQKLFGITKTEAISKISEITKIKLGKTERKDFQNLEIAEIVDHLIDKIDVNNFVYYRLANKNRICVVRHINTGETFLFDGPKMLATHVLSNQLGLVDAEKALIEVFIEKFQEKVLIEAFEEFKPGEPTIFSKQFIKFVNLWVPSDKYKNIHDVIAERFPDREFEIEETIDMLRETCPWTFKYILQLVQKGDLSWFINWLSASSKFVVMPTVPVVFGVQGAGKNLFVSTVMDYYLNNEYVKILNGDRIMNNFNSVLETASLIVLDEGDFSSGKEVDQLKLLTGNNKILVEKKGVDVVNKDRHFNFLFFSNGEVPVRHPAMDRRISYFKNEVSLLKSCEAWGVSIEAFVEKVESELSLFWAIIYKTKLIKNFTMSNIKNGQFWEQVMKMHPFGNLIMKLINRDWKDIALQLNENVSDPAMMTSNLNLLKTIREQFENSGKLSLTLINRYLQSMNYKVKTSIQHYIQVNHLNEFGINISVETEDVFIIIDKKKVSTAVSVDNVLLKEFPEIADQKNVSSLEAEIKEITADTAIETMNSIPGLDIPLPPMPEFNE